MCEVVDMICCDLLTDLEASFEGWFIVYCFLCSTVVVVYCCYSNEQN